MSIVSSWEVTKSDTSDQSTVPSGVSQVTYENRRSSDFAVNYSHNGSDLGSLGAGTSDTRDVSPGDTVGVELLTNPPGERARGTFTFD